MPQFLDFSNLNTYFYLEDHDVVMLQNQKYVYTVELMRRWVASLDSGVAE